MDTQGLPLLDGSRAARAERADYHDEDEADLADGADALVETYLELDDDRALRCLPTCSQLADGQPWKYVEGG